MNEIPDNEPCCDKNNSASSCSCTTSINDSAKSDRQKKTKVIFCVAVLLAVISIVAFKVIGSDSNNAIAANDNAPFKFEQTTLITTSPVVDSVQAAQILGNRLESLNELNTIAVDNDVLFVFIPDPENAIVDDTTIAAFTEALQVLTDNDIAAGLYTLPYDAPDYPGVSGQVELPVILVATKDTGALLIPGINVSANTLLQAFLACCDTSSGCCPQ